MWCSCNLSNTFLSAIRLIDRVGKIPKEKLCIQDVGMPDQHIIKFFGLCERFFEIIIKVINYTTHVTFFVLGFYLIYTF